MKTVIFDLDGTLALVDKRRAISFHKDGSKNWDAWFDPKNIQLDEPHWPVIETARLYKNAGYNIAIISGRSDRTKDATIEWLNQYEVPFDSIQMRPDGGKTKFMGDVPLKITIEDPSGSSAIISDKAEVKKLK